MKTLSSIYLLRTNEVFPMYKGTILGTNNDGVLATAIHNLESLGYKVSSDLFSYLCSISEKDLQDWYAKTYPVLQEAVGAHVPHNPMYPNFPQQVMDASKSELYLNAIMHYFGDAIGVRIMPNYPKDLRPVYSEESNLRELTLGSWENRNALFKNILISKSAFSDRDKEDVESLFNAESKMDLYLPAEFPNKENLAFVTGLCMKYDVSIPPNLYKGATDVLRLAVALSDGDVSLAEPTRFRKFKRAERRLLLTLLESIHYIEEDMLRNKSEWKRLGEILHPGEYKNMYPTAFTAFTKLRNNEKIETFNSKLEKALKDKDLVTSLGLLGTRPGDFSRRLDHVLRTFDYDVDVVNGFMLVAAKVSPTVLLQTRGYFDNKVENPDLPKITIPKGNANVLRVIEPTGSQKFNSKVAERIIRICDNALSDIFAERESLGAVFIDESLKGVAIPFALRSSSESLETFGRGTRFELEDKNTLRFFLHWKDMENYGGRVDVDLSSISFDEYFKNIGTISYYSSSDIGVYSGDITSAPNGASEFIDIDIQNALASGVRYIGMSVHSYTRQKFSDIPECFAGFMSRDKAKSGEIFEPASVRNKADLTSEATQAMPYVFDLETREAIWMDITMPSNIHSATNVASNMSNLELAVRSFALNKPNNLYDLFALHARGRGEQVFDREDADLVFAFDGDVTPRDTEKILGLYL